MTSPAAEVMIGDPAPAAARTAGRAMRYAVFASPKSGTTWVQRLLSAHAQIHCAESRAFGRYFDPHNPTAVHLSIEQLVHTMKAYYHPPNGVNEDRFYEDMLFSVIEAIGANAIAHSGKPIYGEKITPFKGTARAVIDRLASYNPDLRFVHLVRDPRDVIVSGFVHQANIRIRAGHPEAGTYHECLTEQRVEQGILEAALAIWLDCAIAAVHGMSRFEHTMLLRYEDLIERPIEEAAHLIRFVGAEPDSAPACVDRASFRSLSGGRAEGDEDRSSFFRKGIAGDWVNWLSDDQVCLIHDQAYELMTAFGYSQETQH